MVVGGQRHGLVALPTGKTPATHRTGGWVGPMAGLSLCGRSHLHRDFISWPSSL